MTTTLFNYFRSSAAFRVRIALNHKGLPYERVAVHLPSSAQRAPDYVKLNPQGLVPALVMDDQTFIQSMAIIEYLDEIYPLPPLMPGDALGRQRVRALSQVIACDTHPVNNLRILKYLKSTLGHDQTTIDTWYRHWCHEGLQGFEVILGDGKAGLYCHGNDVTMADVCLVPQVFNAVRFEVDMKLYPRTLAVHEALMALPAFDDAQWNKQPDAPPEA
jgi:maleylpyruvate isomerase